MDQTLLDPDQRTLSPLPRELHNGLIAVSFFGLLSFIFSVALFFLLLWRLISWRRNGKGSNQFVILIFNLVLADIQQSMAFLLNIHWLIRNEITVGTKTCWAQGWFVSTGDLSSGVFCLAIGVHTFASVILNYRLPINHFLIAILLCWVFVYAISVIGVGLYPNDIFVRATAWCWVRSDYGSIRLWTHYFFIFLAEFGSIVIYAMMYLMLHQQIRSKSFSTLEAKHAKQAARLMVVYPLVYVVCTLPLAAARMAAMVGHPPSYTVLCFAGAMITSNGWIDVILYFSTRRIAIFSDDPPEEAMGLNTFTVPFVSHSTRFGTTTTIEALGRKGHQNQLSRHGSTDQLFGMKGVKAERTVEVKSEPIELADIHELCEMERRQRPPTPKERQSFDSKDPMSIEEMELPKYF